MPPVLMVELSRFQYNKKSCLTEKKHDELSFDPIICMDRLDLLNYICRCAYLFYVDIT